MRASNDMPLLTHARYAPGEVLGAGAQGVVLRVVDREAPGRALVAKVFRPGAFREQVLLGEFALLARLRAPGVVRAHDLGWDLRTGAPFFVEEHVPGAAAGEWVVAAAPALRTVRLAQIVAQVARALAGLHAAGFVHGDLKPAHVRMRPAGDAEEAVLLDLGAAVSRAREAAEPVAYTSAFAAPEILSGGSPSAASDLYGLGALAWAIAAGRAPERRNARRPLRAHAPWVEPRVAAVIEGLAQIHPRDRPAEARDVLAELGLAAAEAGIALGAPPLPIGRETELSALSALAPGAVRVVIGPSGIGKSHLARELATRERLAGRSVREMSFPAENDALGRPLVAFLRGHGAWPFATPPNERAPLLLVLDGIDAAPAELATALDAYRCRSPRVQSLAIVATARTAPEGSEVLRLEPLTNPAFQALCAELGVTSTSDVERHGAASGNVPGFLVASLGRVPLTKDTAVERAQRLSEGARAALAALAIAGGSLAEGLLLEASGASPAELAELHTTSLSLRSAGALGVLHALSAPHLAGDLATALATPAITSRVARALLAQASAEVPALLFACRSPHATPHRAPLLERAAERARALDLRAAEIEALVALCADPLERKPDRLLRLERLARDAGMGTGYPEVLAWLEEAGAANAPIRLLALRRRAEKAARDGDADLARSLADAAIALADAGGERPARAFARATSGLVALMRASYEDAEKSLFEARRELGEGLPDDPEEIARMDHNTGVVALYRNNPEEAIRTFERALATKRRMGDRAGMRSCLMNLGIALGKVERYEEARFALAEAMGLARSLAQTAGLGWCLSALADIEIRRRDARAASQWLASAAALSAALPAAIQADLVIASAHVALLEGDGRRALELLAAVDERVRKNDPLVDARTFAALASAHLTTLPPDREAAVRCGEAALRIAETASLAEVRAQALAILQAARGGSTIREVEPPVTATPADDDALWAWLAALSRASDAAPAFEDLSRTIVAASGAERAIVAHLDREGHLRAAWGTDVEGFAIAEAARRIAPEIIERALRQASALYERDLATPAGHGSRLSVRAEALDHTALIVVEHRFRAGAFDAITSARAERWAALAALGLRVFYQENKTNARGTAASAPAAEEPLPPPAAWPSAAGPASTTVVPLLEPTRAFPSILGQSLALRRALARLDAAIDSELPVLITGETGTGKELFARALHEHSRRSAREIVALNCGSLPDTLFEAELFGHARGSFTGADRARPGLLSRAEGGTLFLDELGELPLAKQAVLLRALESRRYRPIGSDEERPFDVRIVAATNKDLERAAAERTFRQDLLYRINAVPLVVPPLRARAGDVPLLLRAFGQRASPPLEFSEAAEKALNEYSWPGNVRELLHVTQRLAALGVSRIELPHLPRAIRSAAAPRSKTLPPPAEREPERERPRTDEEQREQIERTLRATGGNISHAAERIGLTRHGLKKRMARLGISAPKRIS